MKFALPDLPFLRGLSASARRSAPPRRKHALDGSVLHVAHGGSVFAVDIRARPIAKRLTLRIDRISGAPRLTIPHNAGRAQIERFLADHAGWIAKRLQDQPPRLPFAPDGVVPVRAIAHRIEHRPTTRGVTRIEARDEEAILIVHGDLAHLPRRVETFLRAEALKDLRIAVARYAALAGVEIGRITLKDTRSRWGSCSARGDLAFSWRLIFAPPAILDYLAAHEVTHRLEMNHSIRYWRHVARLCPDFQASEHWLNRHGASLHLYGRA